jgi:RNA-directed DNA polymerase
MGLLRRLGLWLLHRISPRPIRREISRLAPQDGDGDALQTWESVTVGGPVKPNHRRLAVRDPRLLPKPPDRKRSAWTGRRRKVMTADEATRLFGPTLRTRNRHLRDLAPDEEQLARYGLPVWRNEAELAAALGLTVGALRAFSIHRQRERTEHYLRFAVPKRSGGQRIILAPKKRLKAVQRRLHELLVARLPVSEHAHGFRPGRNVRTAAAPHVGRRVLLRLDLQDFFPSVTFARVRGLLVALGYGYPVATTLAVLMTEAERQPVEIDGTIFYVPVTPRSCPQGAPTSPGLCNAVLLRLDRRLAGLARRHGFAYTRYADDLTFSGDGDRKAVAALGAAAGRIIAAEGFRVNREKTRVMSLGRRQEVCGVTVNRDLGLSRRERRRLRAELHHLARERAAGRPDPAAEERARGRLAYLAMLNPGQARAVERAGQ